jgi:hypothetical protein
MAWLAQPVAVFSYPLDRPAAEARLLSRLENTGLSAEHRRTARAIVVRCVTHCINLGLWRCWSEKLEFSLEELGPTETRVTITAVPSLLRFGGKAGERVTDVVQLVSTLQRA